MRALFTRYYKLDVIISLYSKYSISNNNIFYASVMNFEVY
jgi:hypothetical protein